MLARAGRRAALVPGVRVDKRRDAASSTRLDARPPLRARHAGEQWICVLGGHEPVTIGDDGNVELPVSDGGLSVYAPEVAKPILDSAEQHLLRQR